MVADPNLKDRPLPVRPLTSSEQQAASALLSLGAISGWEWLAAFDPTAATLITFRTDRNPYGAGHGSHLKSHWATGGRCIIHHNHQSGESLSNADWLALLNHPVDEIFAHLADGSIFAGKILNPVGARTSLLKWHDATMAAENALMAAAGPACTAATVGQLSKHMLASALAAKGLVSYDAHLGSIWAGLATANASPIAAGITAAVAAF